MGEHQVSLKRLGWNSYFDALWQSNEEVEWLPARVISQQRGLWRIAGDFAECWAEASGTLRAGVEAGGDWPAAGQQVRPQGCWPAHGRAGDCCERGHGVCRDGAGWRLQCAAARAISGAVLGIGREVGRRSQ